MKRLLILSSVRWDLLWQRHHALATAAASDGWQVDFVEPPLRGVRHAAFALRNRLGADKAFAANFNPIHERIRVLRAPEWAALTPARQQARVLASMLAPEYDLALLYLPLRAFVDVAEQTGKRVAYDNVMDWAAAPPSWFPPRGFEAVERSLTEGRWHHFSDSQRVAARYEAAGTECVWLPPAADRPFAEHQWSEPPADGPVTYFGAVRASELDLDLLRDLSEHGIPVRTVGPIQPADAGADLLRSGVQIQQPIAPADLPSALDSSSALILPYTGGRAATLVPAKLWNCMASNRLVLFSGISVPETSPIAFEELARDRTERVRRLKEIVGAPPSRSPIVEQWPDRWTLMKKAVGV